MTTAKRNVKCVGCGCTDDNACATHALSQGRDAIVNVACHWIAPGVCSRCGNISRAVLMALAVHELAEQEKAKGKRKRK